MVITKYNQQETKNKYNQQEANNPKHVPIEKQ